MCYIVSMTDINLIKDVYRHEKDVLFFFKSILILAHNLCSDS